MDANTVSNVTRKKSNMALGMASLILLGALVVGIGDCSLDSSQPNSCAAAATGLLGGML